MTTAREMRIADLFDLSGRVAIVTGGGAGLGRQIAIGLADAGADVVVCARNVGPCEETAAAVASTYGVRTLALSCDVRDPSRVQGVVDATVNAFGAVDILVNNAGTSWGAAAEDHPLDAWQNVIDVNLTGVFLFSQAMGRALIARGRGGKIVNISSIAAVEGSPAELVDAVAYSASKGGVSAFTRDLAVKWAGHGINVNALAPGWFPSEMTEAVLARSGRQFVSRIPLGRFGGANDLKGAAVFLASRASDFMTGQMLIVDGGQTAT